jgi:hypothetical protein
MAWNVKANLAVEARAQALDAVDVEKRPRKEAYNRPKEAY